MKKKPTTYISPIISPPPQKKINIDIFLFMLSEAISSIKSAYNFFPSYKISQFSFFHIIKLTASRYRIEIMLAPSTAAIDNDTQIYICQISERPLPLTINTGTLLNSHALLGQEIHLIKDCIFYFNIANRWHNKDRTLSSDQEPKTFLLDDDFKDWILNFDQNLITTNSYISSFWMYFWQFSHFLFEYI